jgi:hypothetical protein
MNVIIRAIGPDCWAELVSSSRNAMRKHRGVRESRRQSWARSVALTLIEWPPGTPKPHGFRSASTSAKGLKTSTLRQSSGSCPADPR